MNAEIDKLFGGRVRVRVCGLCWEDEKLLMVNHKGLTDGNFWAPPGGGIDFGKTAADVLKSEFEDETGLVVESGDFRFIVEFINQPLHAIELYFDVKRISGELKIGHDPEMSAANQILSDTRFMAIKEILELPTQQRHGLFKPFNTEKSLKTATGFWKI
jgi:8-oxo-dGTP diphosphatase